jgi:hypothetical protein
MCHDKIGGQIKPQATGLCKLVRRFLLEKSLAVIP